METPRFYPLTAPALTALHAPEGNPPGNPEGLAACPCCGSTDVQTVARPGVAWDGTPATMPGWGWAVRCDGCGHLGPFKATADRARQIWNEAPRATPKAA